MQPVSHTKIRYPWLHADRCYPHTQRYRIRSLLSSQICLLHRPFYHADNFTLAFQKKLRFKLCSAFWNTHKYIYVKRLIKCINTVTRPWEVFSKADAPLDPLQKCRFALSCSYKKDTHRSPVRNVTGPYAVSSRAAGSGDTCAPTLPHRRTKGKSPAGWSLQRETGNLPRAPLFGARRAGGGGLPAEPGRLVPSTRRSPRLLTSPAPLPPTTGAGVGACARPTHPHTHPARGPPLI